MPLPYLLWCPYCGKESWPAVLRDPCNRLYWICQKCGNLNYLVETILITHTECFAGHDASPKLKAWAGNLRLDWTQVLQLLRQYGPQALIILEKLAAGTPVAALVQQYGPLVLTIVEAIVSGLSPQHLRSSKGTACDLGGAIFLHWGDDSSAHLVGPSDFTTAATIADLLTGLPSATTVYLHSGYGMADLGVWKGTVNGQTGDMGAKLKAERSAACK